MRVRNLRFGKAKKLCPRPRAGKWQSSLSPPAGGCGQPVSCKECSSLILTAHVCSACSASALPPAGALMPPGSLDCFLFPSPSKIELPETFNLALPHSVCLISSTWLVTIWEGEPALLLLLHYPTYTPSLCTCKLPNTQEEEEKKEEAKPGKAGAGRPFCILQWRDWDPEREGISKVIQQFSKGPEIRTWIYFSGSHC